MESQSSPSERSSFRQGHVLSGMSSTLRERLKRCGRYHPATPTSISDTSHILPDTSISCSPGVNRTVTHASLPLSASERKLDNATPKRKPPGLIKGADCKNGAEFMKRKKIRPDKELDTRFNSASDTDSSVGSCLSSSTVIKSQEQNRSNEKNEICSAVLVKSCVSEVSADCDIKHQCGAIVSGEQVVDNGTPSKSCMDLKIQKAQLESALKEKEEQLRKLKMVKMYREKNDLTELQGLINTWRDVSQKALVDLLDLHTPPKPTMTALIAHLQIDSELICYDADEESFS